MKELLQNGAKITESDHGGWTPFIKACENGQLEAAKLLVEHGADVNAQSSFGWTALTQASEKGHVEVVKWLLEKGADVNWAKNYDKYSPIWLAVSFGHVDVCDVLCEHGADLGAVDKEGTQLIVNAALMGHAEVLKWLVSKGADLRAACENYGNTPFLAACKDAHIDLVKYLLSLGVYDVSAPNRYRTSAMNFAVVANNLELIKLLFKHGWKLHPNSNSPMIGVMSVEILDCLLEHGLSLSACTNYGTTPLDYAAYNGNLTVVKRMIERGADPRHVQEDGTTAFKSATSGANSGYSGAAEVAEYLSQFN